jgi:magnesium transporter
MNFDYMPELHTQNGFYVTLGFMAAVTIALLFYFWRKGWIFERNDEEK